jgi:transposase
MKETVKGGPVIQMDETPVQVIGEEGRGDTQKSYMWLARGGPPGKKVAWYEYHKSRAGKHAKEFLEGYCGYLQTDGYGGYDTAVKGMAASFTWNVSCPCRAEVLCASKVAEKPESVFEKASLASSAKDRENPFPGTFSLINLTNTNKYTFD